MRQTALSNQRSTVLGLFSLIPVPAASLTSEDSAGVCSGGALLAAMQLSDLSSSGHTGARVNFAQHSGLAHPSRGHSLGPRFPPDEGFSSAQRPTGKR